MIRGLKIALLTYGAIHVLFGISFTIAPHQVAIVFGIGEIADYVPYLMALLGGAFIAISFLLIAAGRNPLEHFFKGEPYNLIKENDEYRLVMKLPFIVRDDIELSKLSDELIIRVGSFKRHMLLPRQVAASKTVTAKLEGQHLNIHFKGEENG